VLVAGIPYQFLAPYIGPTGAGCVAVTITLMSLGALGWLAWKTLDRRSDAPDIVALAFLSYGSLLALAVVVIRARVHGWEYVAVPRYSNISAFALVGLILAWLGFARQVAATPLRLPLRWIGGVSVLLLLLLSWLGSIRLLYSSPEIRNDLETYMIPYTLDPWTLTSGGMTSPRRLRAADEMREALINGRKGVFGSDAYLTYLDSQTAATDANLPSNATAELEILHVEPTSSGRLLHVRLDWKEGFSTKGGLCILVVDGKKAGWALPVDLPIGPLWWMEASRSPTVAHGFALAPSESHELYAVLADNRGVWSQRSKATHIP